MTEPNYYKILDIASTAESAEIRTAYRRKVRHAHPDAGGDPATFHALQEAYETLSDPQRRSEHDASRGIKRPIWRPARRTPGRHAKSRKVKAWRINTTVDEPGEPAGNGEVMSRPWFVDIDPKHRLRYAPSVWQRGAITAGTAALWTFLNVQMMSAFLDSAIHAALKALVIPYALLVAVMVIAACARNINRTRPVTIVACAAGCLLMLWWTSMSVIGVIMALHLACSIAVPWTMRRLRNAIRLRAAVHSALRDFNAFAPGGSRPSADRRTGAVLRALLERLPAARLFVRVPMGNHRAEYTVVCGRRVAIITPPNPRSTGDSGAAALPGAIDDVTRLLQGAQVRGFVVWPNLPVDRISGEDAVIRHLSAPDAAGEIGRWLASEPYTLHLPTLRRLRDRLASAPSTDARPRSTVEV